MTDHYRGSSHPVLDLPDDPPSDLLAEMDAIADDLRANPLHVAADDAIAFRQLVNRRRPYLTPAQFQDLFGEWRERYAAKVEAAGAAELARLDALRRRNPPGGPFVCVCGEAGDPSDPAWAAIHQPHVMLTGLDKLVK